ncbi:chromosome partitioning protein [Cellulomonas bogoriensis]|uniref:Chromosome partitioning protein n=1 Tax=Cellulomonas bogoriensis 69B4 = DSM 16987 TaxID=1386082 RepID=A0A0A0C021_9CELL|nr:chromosome partitioning protein [Cellulomonas bogoriensis]KGM14023.1 chromosome partitioning protein [Cellulomonas bogoriensis 69B4 = DSM 16987]
MTENLPDSFDPKQPDLPTKAVDPDPIPADDGDEDTPKETTETS